MMLFKLQSYVKYIVRATNEHDVHSPFVFNFLTQALYQKPKLSKDKTLDILLKSSRYFNIRRARIIGNEGYTAKLVEKHPILGQEAPLDVIYVEHMEKEPLSLVSAEDVHNDSLVLINHIRKDSHAFHAWRTLIEWPQISVSIDFYSCGMIFFRKEQEKQHFTIRI